MASLPAFVIAHANDSNIRRAFLVEIAFSSGTVYWTSHDLTIYAADSGGTTRAWTPKPIAIRGIGSRQGETAYTSELEVGDAGALASTHILDGTAKGTAVYVSEAWFATRYNLNASAVVMKLRARIAQAESAESGEALVGVFHLAARDELEFRGIPRRSYTEKGSARYKDAACAATGADTSCPGKTYASCSGSGKVAPPAAGGNRIRFCGFRYLPQDGYTITWGDGRYVLRTGPETPPTRPPVTLPPPSPHLQRYAGR